MTVPASLTPDVVVSSAAAVRSQIQSWIANWAGTVPSGKTATSQRVVGFNASIGSLDLSNLVAPYQVWVRPVGAYTPNDCSVKISGDVDMGFSTRIGLMLAHKVGGKTVADGSTDCGYYRCFFQVIDVANPITGVSGFSNGAYSMDPTDDRYRNWTTTRFFVRDCRMGWCETGSYIQAAKTTEGWIQYYDDLLMDGNVYEWVAHDAHKTDALIRGYTYSRNWDARMRYGSPGESHHEDFHQTQGGKITNGLLYGNVSHPDKTLWIGTAGPTNTHQSLFTSNGGQWDGMLIEHNLVCSNSGAVKEGDPGQFLDVTPRYNTFLHTGAATGGFAVNIIGPVNGASHNAIQSAGGTQGGDGTTLILPVDATQVTDWTQCDPYFKLGRCPRGNDTFKYWEPMPGTPLHWDYPGQKKGGYLRLKEIFVEGKHPGNVGWPVAPAWTEQFNSDGGVPSTYNGSFDADGNNLGAPPPTPGGVPTGGFYINATLG